MDSEPDGGAPRYRAFISYSHRDSAFGRRLHRALESYVLPRRLVGLPGPLGPTPRRLSPIFRDREELSAAPDLSAEVLAALAASSALVVVCSPTAAASPWVGREIEAFRALHPDRPVLAALIEGEPAEAFPSALAVGGVEPLAADFRRGGDGSRLALLKLVAGIAGVGLDQLIQRDAQRHIARVTAITAASVAAMLAMAAMTVVALEARAEAERQRAEAEGLVEFMLTDLRGKLEGVGRLDVLSVVNRRALSHYAGQDLKRLSPAALERRARVLHAMGEDDMRRGDLDRALAQFDEARRTTAALLAARPDDPDRIFAQAQSVFWVAYVDYERGRFGAARAGFETYRTLAQRLVAIAPGRADYQRELGYAEGNLCSVTLERPIDRAGTLRHCAAALTAMEIAARGQVGDPTIVADLVNRQGWLADAYQANQDLETAKQLRLKQEASLRGLMAADPKNLDLRDQWIGVQRALARLEAHTGHRAAAAQRLGPALNLSTEMIALDPANERWKSLGSQIREEKSLYGE